MRIGIIAPPWLPVPPKAYGGTEAVVDLLARGLAGAGHDVVLAAAADSTCPVPRVEGLAVSYPQGIGRDVDLLSHTIASYTALDGMDLVHDHTLAGPLYRYRPPRMPVAATVHGPLTAQTCPIYREMSRDTALIAISRHQAGTAVGFSVERVIHHGIDADPIPVGDGEGGYACFLGRMDPSKGVLEAIQVATLAGIPLRIAAKMYTSEEHEYYEAVIKPLLNRDIEYVGEVQAEHKYRLLGGAVALLNPIQWAEPFGMVMIEALATGTPIVGTPRGSAPEIVREGTTGFLRTGTQGLANALVRASTLDRAACRRATITDFSARRMVAEHIDFYTGLVHGGPQATTLLQPSTS
ncbi:glycosyl transferase [Zafaria cholistanensis]|uniref:Glycosyl transferase n=1 Tax=Zafaria cholistanensis TaxID=1682741 RepID=A0A5A7NLM2_9MICC|nr:glycosyltransferase family 4 protein [Zafaria cholistanensis]GER21844.1 glycosyl transferase [Zafaria cholistanensis]